MIDSLRPLTIELRHVLISAVITGVMALAGCGFARLPSSGSVQRSDLPRDALTDEAASSVAPDVARLRAATASYHALDSAVAAGYARHVANCLAEPPHGAMGYHHVNRALLDARIDPDRPEILLYARTAGGEYALIGVEFIVPYSARPRTAEPPTVMGQTLKPSDLLELWYLHVWAWRENPSGLFADWNPDVTCDDINRLRR